MSRGTTLTTLVSAAALVLGLAMAPLAGAAAPDLARPALLADPGDVIGGDPAATTDATADPTADPTAQATAATPGDETADGDIVQENLRPVSVTAPGDSGVFRGMAFDTCKTPPVEAMDAWRASSYGAIGIYIGGVSASCKPGTSSNPYLDAAWVDTVTRMGWKLIPIYVGLQAPGTRYKAQMSTKPPTATTQGEQAAQDAVNQMTSFGLGPGNPIYLDVEAWPTKDKTANAAVISFTHGWTTKLHELGYVSGFYSSANGGINVINARALSNPTGFTPPDAMWFARWYSQGDTSKADKRAAAIAKAHTKALAVLESGFLTEVQLDENLWRDSQRGWQYLGGHIVEHGGFKINIDSNIWDGPIAPAPVKSIALNATQLAPAVFDTKYTAAITAKKPKKTYAYQLTNGALPDGITLGRDGSLTGKTQQLGTWSFTVSVTDTAAAWNTGTRSFTLTSGFRDVTSKNDFLSDIEWLGNSKITTGYAGGVFKPAAAVTRQAMAAYLYRYANPSSTSAPKCSADQFKDVPKGNEFCGEIAWLVSTGITSGYADGTFRPSAPISRQAMAAFLYRLEHPEEMAQLAADIAADAQLAADRQAAVKAAEKTLAAAEATEQAARKDLADANASTKKAATKKKLIAAAEAALAEAKAQTKLAAKELKAAQAEAKKPAPNHDICVAAPSGVNDIAADAGFCRQIAWLVTTGITTGYPDGGFHATASITRQAMAAFLHRLTDL